MNYKIHMIISFKMNPLLIIIGGLIQIYVAEADNFLVPEGKW